MANKGERSGLEELAIEWAKARHAALNRPEGTSDEESRKLIKHMVKTTQALYDHCKQFTRLD